MRSREHPQDQWVFAVIVPVMPFTLHDQVGIPESQGLSSHMFAVRIHV